MIIKVLALLGLVTIVSSAKSYENFKVYNIIPSNNEQIQKLEDLKLKGYDFWTDHLSIGNDARVMVSPDNNEEFLNYVKQANMNPTTTIENLQRLIENQNVPTYNNHRSTVDFFNWNSYHTLEVIHAWIDRLSELFPGVVRNVTIGTSYEGRNIKGVIIDLKAGNRQGTPLIGMIEGGIHAREWISPATVTWIIEQFLTSNDTDVKSMAESFVWHIFPVVNPDGYVYTFENDRMWRKNRNPANFANCPSGGSNDLGNGIDLNRNFNYLWMSVGASSTPCTTTYAGPSPASELETQAIANYVQGLKSSGNLLYYIAFHSYSQMILIPYSHLNATESTAISNYADLYHIASKGQEKLLATHGTNYTYGTAKDILYEVSGSSFDWVKGVAEVPITFLFELRDLGSFGFLLPTSQIIPNNEEIMACLIEMDITTRSLNYYSSSSGGVFASVSSLALSVTLLYLLR